jgi:hypothetical protein
MPAGHLRQKGQLPHGIPNVRGRRLPLFLPCHPWSTHVGQICSHTASYLPHHEDATTKWDPFHLRFADFRSSYHTILNRPMLAEFMAIPHHAYLIMRIPPLNGSFPSTLTSSSPTTARATLSTSPRFLPAKPLIQSWSNRPPRSINYSGGTRTEAYNHCLGLKSRGEESLPWPTRCIQGSHYWGQPRP